MKRLRFFVLALMLSGTQLISSAASRGVRLTWDQNPPEELVQHYRIYARSPDSGGNHATNWTVPAQLTNLLIFWLDKEAKPEEETNAVFSIQKSVWPSTNLPPWLAFSATAINRFGESDFSGEVVVILGQPRPPHGIGVKQFYGAKEVVELHWPDLPTRFELQSSINLEAWAHVVTVDFGSTDENEMPWQLGLIQIITNRPAMFWRKIDLLDE